MLNEKNEIMALLNGERINKKHTYRSCYLLAKYFKSLKDDPVEIREKIFDWAKEHEVYISDDLNSIIQRALKDKRFIVEKVEVKISREDIKEIVKRFDKYNTRIIAFAILCFAKVHADKNGLFYMSLIGLSNWVRIEQPNLFKYIKELIDFGYIEKISKNELNYIRLKNKSVSKMLVYKIKVNYKNIGEYLVKDYDIRKEFEEILSIYE